MDHSKRGLGRGIASLIPSAALSQRNLTPQPDGTPDSPAPFLMLAPTDIAPNPHQPRKHFDEAEIEGLASSIREKGILTPLLVTRRSGKYQLISGERRLRAAQRAGLEKVPVVVREADSSEMLELAVIENVQRADLDPIEEATALQELIDRFGYTQEEVAKKMGRDRTTIANTLRLLRLPTKIREALQIGQITVGHARALLAVPEIERQFYLLDQAVQGGWSVRQLEGRISSLPIVREGKKKKGPPLTLATSWTSILEDLRRRLGTQVRLIPSGRSGKGKIVIEYYSEVDLDRIHGIIVR